MVFTGTRHFRHWVGAFAAATAGRRRGRPTPGL